MPSNLFFVSSALSCSRWLAADLDILRRAAKSSSYRSPSVPKLGSSLMGEFSYIAMRASSPARPEDAAFFNAGNKLVRIHSFASCQFRVTPKTAENIDLTLP